MKRLTGLIAIIILVAGIAGCSKGTSSGEVIVDVNGTKITEGDLKFLGEVNPRIQAQLASPAGQKRILDNLVEQDLLYQEAVKEGINRDQAVKAKVDLYRRVIIAQSLVDDAIEKAANKYYDEHQDEFKKLSVAQILIKFETPAEIKKAKDKKGMHTEKQALELATEVKAKIDGGMPFAQAAREFSEDVTSKARGGELGLVSKDDRRLVARGYEPLLEKAFTMKVGEVSGPIKTDKGYSLITITRGIELEPFDEAKQAIVFKVRNDARQALLTRLKKEATIVYPAEEKAKAAAEKAKKDAPAAAPVKKMEAPAAEGVKDVKAAAQQVKEKAMKELEKKPEAKKP